MSVVAERSNLQPRVRKRTLAGEKLGRVSTAAAEDYWSRSQYCVRPNNDKPINPRTFSFAPPSSIERRHLYVLPLSGSSMVPPDQASPSFCKSHRIFSPTTGRPFCSPVHGVHRGFGSWGSGSTSFWIRPYNLPASSQMVTTDLTLPVASSTVFHRPTGEVSVMLWALVSPRAGVESDPSATDRTKHKTRDGLMRFSYFLACLDVGTATALPSGIRPANYFTLLLQASHLGTCYTTPRSLYASPRRIWPEVRQPD